MNYKEELFAKRIKSITGLEVDSEEVVITFEGGATLIQTHDQTCCEHVAVHQVDGNPSKFIGAIAYELIEKVTDSGYDDDTGLSTTATFYTLKTSAGYLDWRWYGVSNGYYSESVDTEFNRI